VVDVVIMLAIIMVSSLGMLTGRVRYR